jgi:hypothetical protein
MVEFLDDALSLMRHAFSEKTGKEYGRGERLFLCRTLSPKPNSITTEASEDLEVTAGAAL